MKKIIALLLCCTCIALSGCSVEVGDMQTEEKITSFDGVWRQASAGEDEYLEAVIEKGVITITMIYDGGNKRSVYWHGTAPELTEPVLEYTWISNGDTAKTRYEVFGSPNETKRFIYMRDYLWFPWSMFGYSNILQLERVEE